MLTNLVPKLVGKYGTKMYGRDILAPSKNNITIQEARTIKELK